ncbi:MAG: GNAT family N-acetyltransferase, partial [Acidimicrobiales bacterium]
MSWPTLHTERLVLRPLVADDLAALVDLHAQEAFWRYPFRRGWSRDETQAFLERTRQRYTDPGM